MENFCSMWSEAGVKRSAEKEHEFSVPLTHKRCFSLKHVLLMRTGSQGPTRMQTGLELPFGWIPSTKK